LPVSLEWISPEAEKLGFDRTRLQELSKSYHDDIVREYMPGANLLIAKSGQIVFKLSIGYKDVATAERLEFNDIFRLYSMTKPIAAVLSLQQIEQGLYDLQSPVSQFLPEVAKLRVLNGDKLETQSTPMTVWHLLTHTSGFSATWSSDKIGQRYRELGVIEYQPHQFVKYPKDLQDFYARLLNVPLAHQPGAKRTYGISNDVQGLLIQKAGSLPLRSIVGKNILTPLSMYDTDFCITGTKQGRLVSMYRAKKTTGMELIETGQNSAYRCNVPVPSLSGGLIGTIEDYWHFAEMLRAKGSFTHQTERTSRTTILGSTTQESV